MSSFTVPVSIIPCPGCCVPVASISYVSATGNVNYEGYIDPRYMFTGVEFGSKASSGSVAAYSAGKTYSTIHRVFSAGKFYRSIQIANIGNTPASSPTFWTEVEAPRHWLEQDLSGWFSRFTFNFCNSTGACSGSIPPGNVISNAPAPGMNCTRRDFIFGGGPSTIDHTTGAETWAGSVAQYDSGVIGRGGLCNQGSLTATITNQTNVLNTFLDSMTLGAMYRDSAASASSTFLTNIPSCVGGPSFGSNCGVYVLNSAIQRVFSLPELASAYLTPSGTIGSTLSGTWSDAWTQTTARSSFATFAMTGGAATTNYTLTINYSASGGPTPPTEIYLFTTDGSGNATVIVPLPFGGGGGQTVSIGSYVIT